MSLLFRKVLNNSNKLRNESQLIFVASRKLSFVPSLYDGERDPAPTFFLSNIQKLLRRLTRPNEEKIFYKRTYHGNTVLKTPFYKFLTDEELDVARKKAQKRAKALLQMPPVVKIHQPINNVLSKDAALTGHDTAKFVFTDITFGIENENRLIVERDIDGTLREADYDTRKRLNQVYFPIKGRQIRDPVMFTDEGRLYSLLNDHQYLFVLDRACLQYEPDEAMFQRINSITYQHVDFERTYDILRSTRHFGPLVFYLSWHRTADGLMNELLQTGAIRDAVCLIVVRHTMHNDITEAQFALDLLPEILNSPIQLTKPEVLTEEDIALDNKCVQCVEKYIQSNSSMKSQQELALQGFREDYQQTIDFSRGLRKAHGIAS